MTARPPCHGMTDLYFPDYKERPEATAERLELCRRICSTCEQIIHCSLTAFLNGEEGIWAGRLHTGSDVPKANTRRARTTSAHRNQKAHTMTRSPFGTSGFANPNPRTLTPCPRCKRLRDATRKGPCGLCATTRRRKDDDE